MINQCFPILQVIVILMLQIYKMHLNTNDFGLRISTIETYKINFFEQQKTVKEKKNRIRKTKNNFKQIN